MPYFKRTARLTGISHRAVMSNGQDSSVALEDKRYVVGVVADGMGSGEHSEVFALLATHYVSFTVLQRLRELGANDVQMELFCRAIWFEYRRYLENALNLHFEMLSLNPKDKDELKKQFVHDYMMHTMMILIVDKTTNDAWTFSMGDGYELCDNDVIDVGQHFGQSSGGSVVYGALSLGVMGYDTGKVGKLLKAGFRYSYLGNEWARVAIATDGLRYILDETHLLWHGDAPDETDLLNPERKISALQGELGFSAQNMDIHLEDDLAVVTVENTDREIQSRPTQLTLSMPDRESE